MPANSAIPLLPHPSATALAHIGANGKPSASAPEFGDLFRQKAGAHQIYPANAAPASEQNSKPFLPPETLETSVSRETEDQKSQTEKIPLNIPGPETSPVKQTSPVTPQPQNHGNPDVISADLTRQMKQESCASAENSKESVSVSATKAGTASRPGSRGAVPADSHHKPNESSPALAAATGTVDAAFSPAASTAMPVLPDLRPAPNPSSLSFTQPAISPRFANTTPDPSQANPKNFNANPTAPAPTGYPENRADVSRAAPVVARSQEQTSATSTRFPNPQQGTTGAVEGASSSKDSQSPTAPHSSPTERTALPQHADTPAASAAAAFAPTHPSASQTGLPQTPSAVLATVSAAAPAGASIPNGVVDTPNIYDKLDQGSAPMVLHSGAQHVAVGVRDPDFGWVEIKTQNIAGQVNATLVTTSGQTHASLALQLPAMAQYLEQREVRLGTLAVHHEMPGSNAGTAPSGNQSSNPDSARSGGQDSGHSGEADRGGIPNRYSGASSGSVLSQTKTEEVGSWLQPISFISVRV